jgi:hypothetical protein
VSHIKLLTTRSHCRVADRSLRRQAEALVRVQDVQVELDLLESSLVTLDPTLLPEFKRTFSEKGGEQFRPNEELVKCEWRLDFDVCHV